MEARGRAGTGMSWLYLLDGFLSRVPKLLSGCRQN